jgi:hypothetical protein
MLHTFSNNLQQGQQNLSAVVWLGCCLLAAG